MYSCLFFVFAAPSAPENFMATDVQARSVSFSWSRPLSPNGNIDAYIMSYFNTTHNINLTLMAEQRMVTVEDLNEFTDYTFELRARTGAGLGEPAIEIQMTEQAGIIQYISVFLFALRICASILHINFDRELVN